MQRAIVAGGVVVVAALAIAAFFLTGSDDRPAQTAGAPEVAVAPDQPGSDQGGPPPAPAEEQAAAPETAVPPVTEEPGEGAAQAPAVTQTVRATTAGAEPARPAETQTAAVPPQDAPVPVVPRFDVVRVEPSGEAVIAGIAAPHSTVVLLDADEPLGRATADATGAWVIILEQPLAPGDHELGLRSEESGGGVRLSETVVVVSVPAPTTTVAAADSEAATPTQQSEPVPLAVLTPREGSGASRVLQQPAEEGLRDRELVLNAVDYDTAGFVVVSGRAEPGARVIVYLDDQPLGYAMADADGYWQVAPAQPVSPGLHHLRVDRVDAAGRVLARVATMFSRAELAGGFPEDRYVIVQPGNSLWRIARRNYGRGIRYSVIFQANRNQIRDPDLIYPGQIFVVPSVN